MMNIRRIATVGIAAGAFALAGPAAAMADSYESNHEMAGPDGASSHSVSSNSGGGGGGASYDESQEWAGPDGAGSSSTSSSTGDNNGGLVGSLLGL